MSDSYWLPFLLIFAQIFRVIGQQQSRGGSVGGLLTDRDGNLPLETGFVDSNGNKYKTTVFNFCPPPCSCLGEYFECKKQGLRQIPVLPEWVRSLELPGNKLDDSVEESIGNLTELISLNLKKNQLYKMPIFKGLISLEKLNLAHNRIQIITGEALLSLPNLKELDLVKNRIKIILPNVFPSENLLSYLNLNGNQLGNLKETTFDNLKNLVELHLSHNHLQNLPHDVFKSLNILKKLDLSSNGLNITWSIFKGLEQLRILKLRSNGIEFLPDGVFQALKSIVTIELDSNRITSLSRSGFFNLVTLTSLSLSNNTINLLETDTWEFVQHLVTLDLSSNYLTEIARQNFKCLSKLKKLYLQQNRIKFIEDGSFGCITNLELLDLSGNRLSWTIEGTTGPFSVLKRLQTLELKDNDVKSINKKAFLGLESLQSLNLISNNITTIQFNAFEPLKSIEKLTLNSAHFICDCNLQWLFGWLSTRNRMQHDGQQLIVCDYPIKVRGKELQSLKDDEDFMCNESPKPRLIKEPSNLLAIKGTNVTLECSAISSVADNMSFQWRRDNFDIRSNETEIKRQTLNNNTIMSSLLQLNNVNRGHNGKYQCVVVNTFGSAYSQRFKITVATYPAFRTIPSNVTLNTGSTARLDCSAYGEPIPQIAWQKDGGNDFPAARERRMHVMTADDAFFIVNAKPSDMGVYTCTAENPAGVIKANATLTVHEPPSFIKITESTKEISTGKSCVLECMMRGSPQPKLRWFKDDQPLQLSDRHYFAAGNQLLIITDTISTDAAIYKCEIENELGLATNYLTLKISKSISRAIMNTDEMTGIIIITVFCCTVGTSIIWVVIIYHTKKGNECNTNHYGGNQNNDVGGGAGAGPIVNQTMNLPSRFLIQQQHQQQQQQQAGGIGTLGTFYQLSNGIIRHDDNDCTSSKDSGTGDSAKRSRSVDDLTLNLNDSNCSNKIDTDSYELITYNQKRVQGQPPLSPPHPPSQSSTTLPSSPTISSSHNNNNNNIINNQIMPTSFSMHHVLRSNNHKFQNPERNNSYVAEQSLPLIVRNHGGGGGNGRGNGFDSNSIHLSNCNSSNCAMNETSMSV